MCKRIDFYTWWSSCENSCTLRWHVYERDRQKYCRQCRKPILGKYIAKPLIPIISKSPKLLFYGIILSISSVRICECRKCTQICQCTQIWTQFSPVSLTSYSHFSGKYSHFIFVKWQILLFHRVANIEFSIISSFSF